MSLRAKGSNYPLRFGYIFKLLVVVVLALCLPINANQRTASMPHQDDYTRGSSAFSANLYDLFAKLRPNENLIYSPLSIETCLAMVRMGADGETAAEIDRALGLPSNEADTLAEHYHGILTTYKDSPILKVANKLYTKIGLNMRKHFDNVLTTKFYSPTEQLNFRDSTESARTINTWVAGQTRNIITDLVSPSMLNEDTLVVLVNAIYFKGEWLHPFAPRSTRDERFYLNEEDYVQVPMMHMKERFLYGDFPELEASALEMPYKNSNLSMFIILPNRRTGLASVEQKLKGMSLGDMRKSMQKVKVNLQFPKFKAEFSVELNGPLKEMGMRRMFTNEAEFGKMLDVPGLIKVSTVIHKAFIEVNELGTEAAAATDSVIRNVRSLEDISEFIADRPFMYIIASQSGADATTPTTMFVGCYCTAAGVREHDEL